MKRLCLSEKLRLGLISLGIFICATPFVSALRPQEQSRQVIQLEEWKEIHQKSDDQQSKRIDEIQIQLAALDIKYAERTSKLDVEFSNLQDEVNSMSNRIWALLLAILAQLAGTVWGMIKKNPR